MQQEEEKIELELPEGEVDIREADVDDTIVDEPEQETTEVVETKDELDSISAVSYTHLTLPTTPYV